MTRNTSDSRRSAGTASGAAGARHFALANQGAAGEERAAELGTPPRPRPPDHFGTARDPVMQRAQARIRELIRREFVKARARNPQFSLRAMAKKLRMTPSALSEILGTERRITAKMAEKILYGLGLPPADAVPLIKACQSGAQQRREDRVKGEEGAQPAQPWDEFDVLEDHAYELIAEWHHFAIYNLLCTKGAKDDPAWIAARLSLAEKEVRASLAILEKLGLLEKRGTKLKPTGKNVKTGSDVANEAIRYSHYQNLELARRALDYEAVEKRHFTALTVPVNVDKLEEVKKRIFAFHGEIMNLVETDPTTEVYRLVVQWFPLTKDVPGGKTRASTERKS